MAPVLLAQFKFQSRDLGLQPDHLTFEFGYLSHQSPNDRLCFRRLA